MKLFKHKNYNKYVNAQVKKNLLKLKNIWVKEEEIEIICTRIRKIPGVFFGICHGVRNAWEVQRFRKILNINVIGTDISPTITAFPNSIQWDFHEIKDEWINNVDFIYSNSFDHSYNPSLCLDRWMSCIKKDGLCFIQWMSTNVDKLDAADCFAATRKEYRDLFNEKYQVIDEIGSPHRIIFIIGHRKEATGEL
jgi:hypothetical protein